jgi:hypothetical protein
MNWFSQFQCCKTNQTNKLRELTFSSINKQILPFTTDDIIVNDEYPDENYLYKFSSKNEKTENLHFQHRHNLFSDSINTSSFTSAIYDIHSLDCGIKFGDSFIKNGKMTIDPTVSVSQLKEKKMSFRVKSMRKYLLDNSF